MKDHFKIDRIDFKSPLTKPAQNPVKKPVFCILLFLSFSNAYCISTIHICLPLYRLPFIFYSVFSSLHIIESSLFANFVLTFFIGNETKELHSSHKVLGRHQSWDLTSFLQWMHFFSHRAAFIFRSPSSTENHHKSQWSNQCCCCCRKRLKKKNRSNVDQITCYSSNPSARMFLITLIV